MVEVLRSYQSPARYLNFYTTRDETGAWYRARAITLALQMRSGEQIGEFGEAVNQALAAEPGKIEIVARVRRAPIGQAPSPLRSAESD